MQLVEQAGVQVLLDRRSSTAEPDVLALGCVESALQGFLDPLVDEVERRSPLHLEGRARVVRENEDRVVIRGIVTPPTLPVAVVPRSPDGPEHVPSHDRGADAGVAAHHEVVVDAFITALLTHHVAPMSGLEYPLVERFTADAEGVGHALVGPGRIAVEGHRNIVDAQLRHSALLALS
jgi:hypothetical protein